MAQRVEPLTCLLLLGGEGQTPPALLNALAERRLRPAVRRDPLETMVEICLRMRDASAQRPPDGVALAVDQPESIALWDDLRAALGRYLPEVPILIWTGEVLRPVDDRPAEPPTEPIASETTASEPHASGWRSRRGAHSPAGAPAGSGPPAPQSPPDPPAPHEESRAAVTGEEMRMLLEPVPKAL